MTTIQRSALLPYPAERLFLLVNDIEAYPQYMDGCVGAEILSRGEGVLEARLDLARGGIAQSFATRNRAEPHHRIELELLEGPFEHFAGSWKFQQLGDMACKVSLDLEFTLSSKLLSTATARLFDAVTLNLVDALSRRARHLYG
ncbi:MAG: type II toxin-antitoxin system RatA family toxin [Halieaceae bacterium]